VRAHRNLEEAGNRHPKIGAIALMALLLSFSSLVPGGPVENRDFSHLSPATFNGFNAFLISLGILGFVTVYFLWKARPWAYWVSIFVGWAFVTVIALDLGKVFPRFPNATGFALGLIMIIDAILATYVIVSSHKALGHL
jgi:uncharacterized membrane protein